MMDDHWWTDRRTAANKALMSGDLEEAHWAFEEMYRASQAIPHDQQTPETREAHQNLGYALSALREHDLERTKAILDNDLSALPGA